MLANLSYVFWHARLPIGPAFWHVPFAWHRTFHMRAQSSASVSIALRYAC